MKINILAPVLTTESSNQFYLNGRVFEMTGDQITELEKIESSEFAKAISAFESFEFTNENVRWYLGTSRFNYNLAENQFTWGNTQILDESFSKHIFAAGGIRYENLAQAELFESIPSMLENFTILDFAASFEGNDVLVDLMKNEGKVFVARYNKANKISKFFEAKNANEALEYVKEQTGEDATSFLSEMLEGAEAEIAKVNEQVAEMQDIISFLKDQREVISAHDKTIAEIKAADDLINSEIKVWESKIAELKA